MIRKLLPLCLLVMAQARAAYLIGNVGDDTAFGNYMRALGIPGYANFPTTTDYSQEVFSVQAKFGNNSSAGGNNELGLHWNYAPLSTPPTNDAPIAAAAGSIQYTWGAAGTPADIAAGNLINALVDFTLTRVGNTATVTFQRGTATLYQASFTDASISQVALIAIRARSTGVGSSASAVKLENIVLNGIEMGSMGNVTTAAGASTVSNFVILGVAGDYTLTGRTTMDWTGGTPGNAALAWQIKNFTVPEPGAALLVPAGMLLILARRYGSASGARASSTSRCTTCANQIQA